MNELTIYCSECGDKCTTIEETFDYSGTHCTNGISGTHHTGHYVSDCCLADVTDEPKVDSSEEHY